jgi:hypothetical protein
MSGQLGPAMERNTNASGLPEIQPNNNALEFDPTLAHLLREQPVTRVSLPYGYDGPWLVSRYADIQSVTNDKSLRRVMWVDHGVSP